MHYQLTKKHQLKTTNWEGGTTTQLAIFPSMAEYKQFNFYFRISYATVDVEESTFTFMPGVNRHLMILNGTLQINHIDRYKKILNKFDIDTFNGEWPTTAKVTDFNIMTRGKANAELEVLILKDTCSQKLLLNEKNNFTGIFVWS